MNALPVRRGACYGAQTGYGASRIHVSEMCCKIRPLGLVFYVKVHVSGKPTVSDYVTSTNVCCECIAGYDVSSAHINRRALALAGHACEGQSFA